MIDPKTKTVTYPISALEQIQLALDEIQRVCLEGDAVAKDQARTICIEMNDIRRHLGITGGVTSHEKFMR